MSISKIISYQQSVIHFFPLFLVLNIYLMLPNRNLPTSLQFEHNQTGEAAKEQEERATDNGLCIRQRTDPYTVIWHQELQSLQVSLS